MWLGGAPRVTKARATSWREAARVSSAPANQRAEVTESVCSRYSVQLIARCRWSAVGVQVGLGLDPLLADLAVDGPLLGDLLGLQADPLDRDGLHPRHRALLVQRDLVLRLGDRRAVQRGVDV